MVSFILKSRIKTSFSYQYMMETISKELGFHQESMNGRVYTNKLNEVYFEKGFHTNQNYPFLIQPYFPISGSNKEIRPEWDFGFVQDDTIRDLIAFIRR